MTGLNSSAPVKPVGRWFLSGKGICDFFYPLSWWSGENMGTSLHCFLKKMSTGNLQNIWNKWKLNVADVQGIIRFHAWNAVKHSSDLWRGVFCLQHCWLYMPRRLFKKANNICGVFWDFGRGRGLFGCWVWGFCQGFVGGFICLGVGVFLYEVKQIININETWPTETTDFLLAVFLRYLHSDV